VSETNPAVSGFFDEATFSVAYVAADPGSGHCVIIDPVLDFDSNSGRTSTESADQIVTFVEERGLRVDWVLDTHPHADHMTGLGYLSRRLGAPTGIGEKVVEVQRFWKDVYNLPESFAADGSQWDRLFKHGETFRVGDLEVEVMHSPGHTSASVSYLTGDAAFVHDTLFMPDYGTARADFPGADARVLFRTITAILALSPDTRLFTGHDYMPGGRAPAWESTVAEQRRHNVHVHDGVDEESFVKLRGERDAGLSMPALLLHAMQVNIRAGRLPDPEPNGTAYLKIPLNRL
jgi:glyoxylase-like metal-dependent hydrolase (beta-lactamase superfamily II)